MGYQPILYSDSLPFQISEIPDATDTSAGVMSPEDKAKLDSIPLGGEGINAFTTLTANYTQPAINANVIASVEESRWAAIGQIVFVAGGGGYYAVNATPSKTSVQLTNLGYAGYSSPGTPIPAPSKVSPGGLRGPSDVIRLICSILNLPPTGSVILSPAGVYPSPAPHALYLVEEQVTLSNYRISMCSGISDDTNQVYQLEYSFDQGRNNMALPITTLTSGSFAKTGSFGSILLPAGTILQVDMLRVAGGGNFSSGIAIDLF